MVRNIPRVDLNVPKGKIVLENGYYQFPIIVTIRNFNDTEEAHFFIDGNRYQTKPVSSDNNVKCVVRDLIKEETKFVDIMVDVYDSRGSSISGSYVLEIPEKNKEVLYPDKIRFRRLGGNGSYRILVSLTDQKSNPIGNLSFSILNKDTGEYLAKLGNSWGFRCEEYIFKLNQNGVLDEKPVINGLNRNITLQIDPIDFRLPEEKLPEIELEEAKKEKKEWYADNNFYGYNLFSLTLILLSLSIIYRHSIEPWVWKMDAWLILASLAYIPFMFSDEIIGGIREIFNIFEKDKEEYYRDIEDRPTGAEKVKEVAKQSALDAFGAGFSQFLRAVFIEGIGHRIFGRR